MTGVQTCALPILFNSLNILYSLVQRDKEKSLEFIEAFSSMYRYILQYHGKESVPLNSELDFLKDYINVIKMRYTNQLTICQEIETTTDKKQIIPFTMQLLMENIIKHNIISKAKPMLVNIKISDEGILIKNKIAYKQCESVSNIGLYYLTTLYSSYGKKFHKINDGETFTIIVPYL